MKGHKYGRNRHDLRATPETVPMEGRELSTDNNVESQETPVNPIQRSALDESQILMETPRNCEDPIAGPSNPQRQERDQAG